MKLKSYENLINSKIEWLDFIPNHWISLPIKYVAIDERSIFIDGDWIESKDLSDEGIRYITTGNIGEGFYKEQGSGFISEDKFEELGCTEVFPGDILISRLNLPIGRSCLVPNLESRIITSVDNVIVRTSKKYDHHFLVYLFSSKDYLSHTEILARGTTMQRISRTILGNIRICMPDIIEQKQIVNFLNFETKKLDQLIQKQVKLIALLKEKRQAIISHAVTKGLDANVQMKYSEVEWIGAIPKHWNRAAIKHIVSTPITDGPHETPEFYDEGIPFVSAEAVSAGWIDFNKIRGYISKEDHEKYSKKYHPRIGDVYMVKSGATTGITAIVDTDIEFNIWSPLAVVRCGEKVLPRFALHFMRSQNFLEAVSLNWSFGTQQNIGMGVIENIAITIPPIDEQTLIVDFIDSETAKIDTLIEKSKKSIELAKEHRLALISAAVTGKIDVRDFNLEDAA